VPDRPRALPHLARGALAAAATLLAAAFLPPAPRLALLGLLLALTAGIYVGFAFLDGRPRAKAVEVAAAAAFTLAALAGLAWRPWVLGAAWLLHVAWDQLHHPRLVDTRIAGWVPPFCLAFDVPVGLAILAWWRIGPI